MLLIDILTLFPEMFDRFLETSIIGRAIKSSVVEIRTNDIRDFSQDKHKDVDDSPYGGGAGMVMKPQPITDCIESVLGGDEYGEGSQTELIFLTPQGTPYSQKIAEELSTKARLVLLCGHYEGIDQRVIDIFKPREISIGDYVLTGGEIPAMVLIDSVTRLLPGAISKEESHQNDSFSTQILDNPHYTRPEVFRDLKVPEVLLSGHHANIEKWRRQQALEITFKNRPDLLASADLDQSDKEFLEKLKQNNES